MRKVCRIAGNCAAGQTKIARNLLTFITRPMPGGRGAILEPSHYMTRALRLLTLALCVLTLSRPAGADTLTASLTYPANGAVNANMSQPITWTTVANVQAYYLYVGTTAGAKDLVNTGAIQSTSYLASGLPGGQTLYARVWAKVGGVWRYTDSTFSAASSVPMTATITYPANGAVDANMSQPIAWTTVANVQAYYLYVG